MHGTALHHGELAGPNVNRAEVENLDIHSYRIYLGFGLCPKSNGKIEMFCVGI